MKRVRRGKTATAIVSVTIIIVLSGFLLLIRNTARAQTLPPQDWPPLWFSNQKVVVQVMDLATGSAGQAYHGGGINSAGQVVCSAPDQSGSQRAMLWNHGARTLLPIPVGCNSSTATGINDAGVISGYVYQYGGATVPVVWRNHACTELPILSGFTQAITAGINQYGDVVGRVLVTATPGTPWYSIPSRAVVWHNGLPVDLGIPVGCVLSRGYGINNHGAVVGWSLTTTIRTHATLWDHGQIVDLGVLPGGHVSTATAINDNGVIVGASDTADGHTDAVVWVHRRIRDLGRPFPVPNAKAYALNNQNEAVGETFAPGGEVVWEWDPDHGMRVLETANQNWRLERVVGINGNGTVCVVGHDCRYKETTYTPCVLVVSVIHPRYAPSANYGVQQCPKGAIGPELLKGVADADKWQMWINEPDFAYVTSKRDAIGVHVLKSDSVNWKVMYLFQNQSLIDGRKYVLSFQAKSAAAFTVGYGVRCEGGDWHTVGIWKTVIVGPKLKTFTSSFKCAKATGFKLDAPFFLLGRNTGTVWISGVGLWNAKG